MQNLKQSEGRHPFEDLSAIHDIQQHSSPKLLTLMPLDPVVTHQLGAKGDNPKQKGLGRQTV